MKYIYLGFILVLCSCLATKQEYKTFSNRMKTQQPDGEEFVIEITKKAVSNKMVNQNPLVIIDAITLDNKEIEKEQYSILYKEDVQTVDVLDAEKATPIYGDKGTNGLILITRKEEMQKYLKQYLKENRGRASR